MFFCFTQWMNRAEHDRKYNEEHRFLIWAKGTIRRHVHNGYLVIVKARQLAELAEHSSHCPYCGAELWYGPKNGAGSQANSPTLDRVNNENVMLPDNIVIVCHRCVSTKRDRTRAEFVEYCRGVVARYASHFS
jgi:hypothetical protein